MNQILGNIIKLWLVKYSKYSLYLKNIKIFVEKKLW